MIAERHRLRAVRFRGFKALRHFDLTFGPTNILVGPNNAGKSTIIDALRLLATGIRVASNKSPERIRDQNGLERFGYRVPVRMLSVTTENVHSDYALDPALITFTTTSGDELMIFFPPGEDECFMIPGQPETAVRSITQFRKRFPLSIVVLPVLGPLEYHEKIVTRETLKENLATRRASRNFRNYWMRAESGDFERFQELLRRTWPGIELGRPEPSVTLDETWLSMFCEEDRRSGEIYWSGFGFQVWCQVLTHLLRAEGSSLVAVDEAELYLHPDLQRQLVSILRQLGPDIVMATHSSEITSEADPEEVLLIDKKQRRAKRAAGAEGVRAALTSLGSNRSMVLTQLARTKKGLLVEGEDFKTIRAFARILGRDRLATGLDFAVVPLGGFRDPKTIRSITDGMGLALGEALRFAVILDRDYRGPSHREDILTGLGWADVRHVLHQKELENYLLVPRVLDRALARAVRDRASRSGMSSDVHVDAIELLEEVTAPLKDQVLEKVLQSAAEYHASHGDRDGKFDPATISAAFADRWTTLETRLHLVPGKEVLSRLNTVIQARLGVSLSPIRVVASFAVADVPDELAKMIGDIDEFRSS